MALRLLQGEIHEGDHVVVDVSPGGEYSFRTEPERETGAA